MRKKELLNKLEANGQFKEIWIYASSGESICALINGNIGWLMYLQHDGDAGFSTRNHAETSTEDIEYYLNNGQRDVYPKSWSYPINTLQNALFSFLENGQLPKQVEWHNDSN
jgi:hypothetical protein